MPVSASLSCAVFWAPGFIEALAQHAAEQGQQYNELQTALSRSRRFVAEHPFDGYLSLHGHSRARLSALADDIHCAGRVLRADPVRLVPDVDRLVCQPVNMSVLDDVYLQTLIDAFNALFADEGLRLQMSAQRRWYLCLDSAHDIHFSDLTDVLHNNIDGHMPTGTQAAYWRKLLNETQMLFHQINQQHAIPAASVINSIWPWEGVAQGSISNPHVCAVMSNDAAIHGAARLSKQAYMNLANDWDELHASTVTETLLIDLEGIPAMQIHDEWLMPAISAVKTRHLRQVRLLSPGQGFVIERQYTMRFWRRKQTLASLAKI